MAGGEVSSGIGFSDPAGTRSGAGVVWPAGASAPPADSDRSAPRIVRSERYRVKPMSAEDAAMELEATEEDLLVFRDGRTERVNVIYRRKNGDFALIDPEI